MTSTPNSLSAVQRFNKAYVQVPSSPLTSTRTRGSVTTSHVPLSSKLKENTPLRPLSLSMQQQSSSSTLTSAKRKLSDRDTPSQVLDGVIISSKKLRMSMDGSASSPIKYRRTETLAYPNNASEEFPNGFVYCHQCNKKRDAADTIRCTVIEQYQTAKSATLKERACINKYCKHCLKNRYEEDFEKVKLQASGKNGAICGFKCPKCRDVCNCPRCRKSKGLEPVGFIPRPPKVKSSASPSQTLTSKQLKPTKAKQKANAIASAKLKPLPKVNWTPLHLNLDQEEVDQRILIREFFLRFGDFLEPVVAKSHIEELELIGGRVRKQNEDSWVSDMCIKALVISLLGTLTKRQEIHFCKTIKTSVKDLRSTGMNLNKIWTILSRLRDDIAHINDLSPESDSSVDNGVALMFPDPAPPPVVATSARRSLRQTDIASFNITHSSQMIPVLLSLIHSVLETSAIRDEIDQGTKDVRDFGRDARDATKIENERWEKVRSAMEIAPKDKDKKQENRDKRSTHKLQITNIENAFKIIIPSFAPRFTPLGTDSDGCVYYALYPGVNERDSALEYLEHAASGKTFKLKKKCILPSVEERMEMHEWSWFIAVWGKNPSADKLGTIANNSLRSDSNSEEENDNEKWWGFWDPDEITRLAQYISIKTGVDDDDDSRSNESGGASHKEKSLPPRLAQFKRLATELTEYANLLRWRIREDKCALIGNN